MKKLLLCLLPFLFLVPAFADPVTEISYQGKVRSAGSWVEGTGDFKFVISNQAGNASYWSNDGSSVGGGEPAAALLLNCDGGTFNVVLGGTSFAGMTDIPPSIFSNGNDLYLKVWFDDGVHGSQELAPARKIVSAAYAVNAAELDGLAAADFVQTTGDQSIGGVKTFTSFPVSPGDPPVSDYELANKKYVDDTSFSAASAGPGLTGGGGVPLAVGAGVGITVNPDDVALADGGVSFNQLSAAVAGDGLTGGGGSPLDVGAGTAITVNADNVQVADDGINGEQLADTISLDDNLNFSQASFDVNFDGNTLVIDGSADRVGIGTASPGAKLVVDHTAAIDPLRVQDNGTETFRVENGGKIYLGNPSGEHALWDPAVGGGEFKKVGGDVFWSLSEESYFNSIVDLKYLDIIGGVGVPFQVSNAATAVDIARFRDNATTVMSIADGGKIYLGNPSGEHALWDPNVGGGSSRKSGGTFSGASPKSRISTV